MRRAWWLVGLGVLASTAGYYSTRAAAESARMAVARASATNDQRVSSLIAEMSGVDVDRLAVLPVAPLALPEPSVDVMRVRLVETYDITGVGKDSVELKGWIAVRHDNSRPAQGQAELTWNNAVTDTEFVAMDLRGESPLFGPVRVSLDRSKPSVGQVGQLRLPFVVSSGLDAAYLPYRTLFEIDQQAANRPQGTPFVLARQPTDSSGSLVSGARAKPIVAVIDGVIKAIGAKDSQGLLRYYSPGGNNLFFGQTPSGVARGGAEYVRELSKVFANIKTLDIRRNDDVQVRLSGNLAVASLTGVNNVVNNEGQSGSSPWRWTVELEKAGGRWQITHDHLSFFADPNAPIAKQGITSLQARGACCLADLSAVVNLSRLDLEMRTATPVRWYSEVETIPPVGSTASVSATPTALMAGGRQLGTLVHGAVKFREVVRHVPLIDVTRPDLQLAAVGVASGGGR